VELTAFLTLMAQKNASDLLFSAGAAPSIKIEGMTQRIGEAVLGAEQIRAMAYSIMNERQQRDFEASWEMNLAVALGDLGRFRVNIYRQRGDVAMAVRFITNKIPTIESLRLPQILKDIIMLPRGLVLVVGSTSSGKSTTLASMIDYRNEHCTGHILTVEEPIEYVHTHKLSVVDQREIGLDTQSYANALKNAMREAPDVIMIGEIRDRETMQAAIAYAETGHLCLSTLHANNANQTLDRIINFFPESARQQLLIDLSLNLKAVVGQRLLKGTRTKRVPAVELLMTSAYISDLIEKGEIATIREAMKQGNEQGMQTFDQALYRLYAAGDITYQEALDHADSHTDLALRVRLEGPAPPLGEAAELHLEELQDMLADPHATPGKPGRPPPKGSET